MAVEQEKGIRVGRNLVIAGAYRTNRGVRGNLRYLVEMIADDPYQVAAEMIDLASLDKGTGPDQLGLSLDIRTQEKVGEAYLRLGTALLERAWLFGERELVKQLLGK